MRTGKRKRLWALLLSAVLIVMQLPAVAMAENNTPEEGSIASFTPLPDSVAKQTVDMGTELSVLQLPNVIRAMVYQFTEDTEILDEDSPEEREDTTTASPSDGEDRGETAVTVTTSQEEIPVTWDSEPSYDSNTQGEYVFTADVGDYVLSGSAKLPTITVIVIEETVKNKEESQPGEPLPCVKTEGCTLADGYEGDCVTEAEKGSGELLLCAKKQGCTLADGHEGDCNLSVTMEMVSLGDAGISDYDPTDVAAFQAILDEHSSLVSGNVKREDPASWGMVRWDNSSPKRISILTLNNKGLTGTLDVGNLTTLTELYCGQNQLSELKGLENLTNLTTLYCHTNQLSELKGLENLTNLTKLYCYNNQLTELKGLENLTNLTELLCSTNQLKGTLDVGNLKNLTGLYCNNNQLSELKGLEKLTNLTRLDCYYNQLTGTLDVGNLTNLSWLYCNNNQLSELKGLENLTNLTVLECHNNPYTSFTTKHGHTLTVTSSAKGKIWLTSFDKDNNALTLTAEPDSDYVFQEWTGLPTGISPNGNTADFHLNENITVEAVFRPMSTDTKLKSLTLSVGTLSPVFAPAITSYTATVGNSISGITINGEANDTNAQVTGNGTKPLKVGENRFTITVTAEDGKTTKDYTVTITREASTDATLKGLSLSSGTLSPTFDPTITSYTTTVGNSISSITINGEANDTNAKVIGNGTKTLKVGENIFTITVTAEDGKTMKDYTITITRAVAKTDATLKGLSLSSGMLSPAFAPAITSYTATVGNSVSSVTINGEANDTNAKATGNGTKTLKVGENIFTITVTAEDGKTKDYTVTITREANTDTTLRSLTLSNGTLSPAFDPAITSYTATVGYSVSGVTINADANDTKAKVTGDGTKTLRVGENPFTITVTAEDGKTKDYIVTITRAAASSGGGSGSSYTLPKDSYTMTGDSISRSVSRNDLKKLADRGKSLTLSCDKVRMSFQPVALKGILAEIPATVDNITFAAVPADLRAFPDAMAQLSTRPVYDFTISYKESQGKLVVVPVSFPTGSASVSLDYAPAATEITDRLFMVYVDGKGAVTRLDKSSYDHGKVLADVSHFSIYGVAYKAPEPVAPVFADIENHWAKEDIAFAVTRGLLSGTGNNMFSPDSTMTRGMFVTALGRLTDVNTDSYQTCSFTDVKTDAYYGAYVEWAVQKNIVKGIGKQLFSPDAPITREQMAVMMINYAQELGYSIPASAATTTFADNDKISTWAAKEVAAMQQAGIIKGKDGNRFDPQGNATRAEVSAMLHWFVEIVIDSVE